MPFFIAEQFTNSLKNCNSNDELAYVIAGAGAEIGLPTFALVQTMVFRRIERSAGSAAPIRLIRIENYPDGWAERFTSDRIYVDDPVFQSALRTSNSFSWDEVWHFVERRERYQRIFEEAGRLGLKQGYTTPYNVPFEPPGSCTFATSSSDPIQRWRQVAAQLISGAAIEAARRINGWTARATNSAEPQLSAFDRKVLYWIAEGKTNHDIAGILGISRSRVKGHVERTLAKLNSYDRTRAAVVASRAGMVVSGIEP